MAKKTPVKKKTSKPSKSTPAQPKIPKGISRLEWVQADQLQSNPSNWRKHPKRQTDALAASVQENGWAGALLYNESTGRLIDGHARKSKEFLNKLGTSLVPVLVGSWTPEQEKRILLTLDPIAAMAETDADLLEQLTKEVEGELESVAETFESEENRGIFQEVTTQLHGEAAAIEQGAPASWFPDSAEWDQYDPYKKTKEKEVNLEDFQNEGLTTKGVFDLKFREQIRPIDWQPRGAYDIPRYLPNMMGEPPSGEIIAWYGPETPEYENYLLVWGVAALERLRADKIIPCFYTHDHKFEAIWNGPEKCTAHFLNVGIQTIVSPNYSLGDDDPLAYDIWQTYRGHFMARYWQEAGIRVIPDIMTASLYDKKRWDWRFTGIPKNAPCVATELQSKMGEEDLVASYATRKQALQKFVKEWQPQSLLAYAPPSLPENFFNGFPKSLHIIRCDTYISSRSRLLQERRKTGVYHP